MTAFYHKPIAMEVISSRHTTDDEKETLTPLKNNRKYMPNHILLFYQLERIIQEFKLSHSSGQLLIGLSNFKAVMKQMVMRQCYYNDDKGKMFWFEAMLTNRQNDLDELGKSTRYHYQSIIDNCNILFRVRTVVGDHMKNDKLSFKEILEMHPDKQKMSDAGDFKHAHLLRVVEGMYHKFRKNFQKNAVLQNDSEENGLTYYMHLGQLKKSQKPISKIYGIETRFFNNDFPILLYRTVLTTRPLQLVAIFLIDSSTVQFIVYDKDNSNILTMTRTTESFLDLFPFFNQMLSHGNRSEVGRRLLLIMKNVLLLEIYGKTFDLEDIAEYDDRPKINKQPLTLDITMH
jgi:hypothetical protein